MFMETNYGYDIKVIKYNCSLFRNSKLYGGLVCLTMKSVAKW